MTPKNSKKLKTINRESVQKQMDEIEQKFIAKQKEAAEKQKGWEEYVKTTNSELLQLKGAFESLKLLINK